MFPHLHPISLSSSLLSSHLPPSPPCFLSQGQWKQISRVYVPSRTPTQVASHAQKHFLRCTGQTNKARRSRFVDVESRALASGLVSNVTGGSNKYPPTTGNSSRSTSTGTPSPPILPDNNKQRASSSSSWQVGGGDAHLAPLLPLQLAPCPIIAAAPSGKARIIDDNTKGVDQQAVCLQPHIQPLSPSGPSQPQQQPTLTAINITHIEGHQSKSYSKWINCSGIYNGGLEGWTKCIPPPAIIFEGRNLPVLPVRPGRINATSTTGTGTGSAMMMLPVGCQLYRNGNSHGGAAAVTATPSGNVGGGQMAAKKVRTSTRVSQRKSRLATKAAEGGVGNSNRARTTQLFRLLELQERLTHSSSSHQLDSGNDDGDDDDDMVVDDDGYYYYDKVGLPITSRKAVIKGNEGAIINMMMGDEMTHTNDVGTGNSTGKRHKFNGHKAHAVPSSVTPTPPNSQNGGSLYASSSGDFSHGSNSALDALAGAAAAALEQGCSDDDDY